MKKKKPRIKISLKDLVGGDQANMPKASDEELEESMMMEEVDDEEQDDEEPVARPVSRGRRPRKSSVLPEEKSATPRRRGRSRVAKKPENDPEIEDSVIEEDPSKKSKSRRRTTGSNGTVAQRYDADYLDPALLKKEREDLGEAISFEVARNHFIKRGPWVLPEPLKPDKFRDVAIEILKQVDKIDRYSVFAEPVSDEDAPDYSKIVKNPIDLATMKSKVRKGKYGEGSEGAAKLYEDFLLMFDNCQLYNDDEGEVIDEATRIFSLVPETYSGACSTIAKKQK
jgi:hypothetical protein